MKTVLFSWAIIQGFLIGGLLLTNSKTRANKFLSIFFLLMGIKVLGQYLMRFTPVRFATPSLIFIADIIDFIEPVLLLFYLRLLFDRVVKESDYGYFIPGILFTMFAAGFAEYVGPDLVFDAYISSVSHCVVLLLIFGWKCFILLQGHLLIYGENRVAVAAKQKKFLWWPKLLIVFLLVSTVNTSGTLLWHVSDALGMYYETFRVLLEYGYILFNCSLILATGYFFLENPPLFKGVVLSQEPENDAFPGGDFYFKKMKKLLEEDKIYLDSELNEHGFAEALALQPYLLSRLVNQHLGKSFSELINEYRIGEAKRILLTEQGRSMTIYAVALDSGFRSESVFYVNFKKMTGMTPSRFKKSHLAQSRRSTQSI